MPLSIILLVSFLCFNKGRRSTASVPTSHSGVPGIEFGTVTNHYCKSSKTPFIAYRHVPNINHDSFLPLLDQFIIHYCPIV
jgi:hypothetical protein